MEKICATYAMEWSIELEKALRSKKPGSAIEAIKQIGPRLEQWSREPVPTMPVYKVFGLIAGEDKLFANTILLRLADAFRMGDKETRYAIVKIFLLELKSRDTRKKSAPYEGILSKARVFNQEELLRSVKIVFDNGDTESRALALALFGCWAHFAKDSAHIRYLILSSLVSCIDLEVKASLFAAGCFCEFADDFASVTLEMLLKLINSSETSLTVRVAGARVFTKMGCSFSIANQAYKAGLKLLLDSPEEKLLVTMLVSLSRLASCSVLLLAKQVDILISFLSLGKSLRLQATALKCLHFLFMKGVHFHFGMHAIEALVRIVNESELPLAIKCEAAQVLQKIIFCRKRSLSGDSVRDSTYALTIVKILIESPVRLKKLQSICVLVDAMKAKGKTEIGFGGNCLASLIMEIVSTVMDRVLLLVKQLVDLCQFNKRNFQDILGLLSLLLLVGEDPELGLMVLERSRSVVDYLFTEVLDVNRDKSKEIKEKVVCFFHKFLVSCAENLNRDASITYEVINKVKLLVESVQQCSLFGDYVHIVYSLLLQSHIFWSVMVDENKETLCDESLVKLLLNCLIDQNIFSFKCVENMLTQRNAWLAYKAAMFAACHGAWPTARFIFEKLITSVHSKCCSCWLKSLAQFAQSQSEIQLDLLPKLKFSLEEKLHEKEVRFKASEDSMPVYLDEHNYFEVLTRAYNSLCSSFETIKSISKLGTSFWFQRWFLSARAKTLGNMVDVLKTLGGICLNHESWTGDQVIQNFMVINSLETLKQLRTTSVQLMRLAHEYDLMATSCIDMNRRNRKVIGELAFCCSLLAFTTGFALFISDTSFHKISPTCGLEGPNDALQTMLLQNLVTRLQHIDQETCSTLSMLVDTCAQSKHSLHMPPGCPILKIDGDVRAVLDICTFAASGIVCLKNKSMGLHNGEDLFQVTKDGFQLLSKTTTKLVHIPLCVPKYFFDVRPCVGSELFAYHADAKGTNELLVLPGYHLSLNCCLQLKNLPPDLSNRVSKLYCILYASTSFQELVPGGETNGTADLDYEDWETDNMVETNKKLFLYVTGHTKDDSCTSNDRDDGIVSSFISFKAISRGQGFSNCLLDVSDFPAGSYRIKWHSCCIDDRGSYWSLLPLNTGPVFTVRHSCADPDGQS